MHDTSVVFVKWIKTSRHLILLLGIQIKFWAPDLRRAIICGIFKQDQSKTLEGDS